MAVSRLLVLLFAAYCLLDQRVDAQPSALSESDAIAVVQRAIAQWRDHQCMRITRVLHSGRPDSAGVIPILVVANTRCIQMGLEEHKILVLATRDPSDSQNGGWRTRIFKSESSGRFADPVADKAALEAEVIAKREGRKVPGSMDTGTLPATTSPTTGVTWVVHFGSGVVTGIYGTVPSGRDVGDAAFDVVVHGEACRLGMNTRASMSDDGRHNLRPPIVLEQAGRRIATSPLDDCQSRSGFQVNPAARTRAAQLAEAQRKQQADSRAQALGDRFGVTRGWVDWESIRANPFAYVGQVLLFNTQLDRMVSASEGHFTGALFVGLPTSAFMDRRPAVLVGKVLGNAKANFGVGETLVPRIQYLGHEFCAQADCGDFGTWRGR